MNTANYHNPFDDPALASSYDSWFETPLGRTVDRLEKRLIYRLAQPKAGESALDVGTGTGHFACDLAARGLRVTGYDSSEAMLQVARAKGPGVRWQRGEVESLPFADGSFDLVLSVTTLEFVRDRDLALAEMYRVTAPGGRMVVAVLNALSPWGQARKREAAQHDTPFRYAHFFTPKEFVTALGRYGCPRWSSSVFFLPSGVGMSVADLLESLGQVFCRRYGALLVGRVDK
jgi:ubiquinone/menaquinone biosynthesis C-methylase UbiE